MLKSPPETRMSCGECEVDFSSRAQEDRRFNAAVYASDHQGQGRGYKVVDVSGIGQD